jgi:anthranilate synthase component 1
MKKIEILTTSKQILADVFTPVSIYLRLRDRFRDTVLMESTDHHAAENSYSFICINAIGGIEIIDNTKLEYKLPGQKPETMEIKNPGDVPQLLWDFMNRFECIKAEKKEIKFAQGFFGYTSYDAVHFFENINSKKSAKHGVDSQTATHDSQLTIPLIRYRLYQYVIAFNHYKDELFILENNIKGIDSEIDLLESLIRSKDVPVYPFKAAGEEKANMTDDEYKVMVKKGITSCHRGDVFQIVLSRSFQKTFTGDEFNVYRALRSINPSPYLFFFDYGDYKLIDGFFTRITAYY